MKADLKIFVIILVLACFRLQFVNNHEWGLLCTNQWCYWCIDMNMISRHVDMCIYSITNMYIFCEMVWWVIHPCPSSSTNDQGSISTAFGSEKYQISLTVLLECVGMNDQTLENGYNNSTWVRRQNCSDMAQLVIFSYMLELQH